MLQGSAVSLIADNFAATHETGEPLHADRPGDASVWWAWTAPASGPVTVTTAGSNFDTLLAVYAGVALSNLTPISSGDDDDSVAGLLTSSVVFSAVAATTYKIAVDGYDGETGQIALQISVLTDSEFHWENPRVLPNGSFTATLSGSIGMVYEIEASEQMEAWTSLGFLTNTTGEVQFQDPALTNVMRRFYRARIPGGAISPSPTP